MSTGYNYDAATAEFLAKYYARFGSMTNPNMVNNQDTSVFAQIGDNTCTDGIDDGEIGFWSKVGNAAEGVWDMGKNLVGNIIKHPFKTAAMIGVCCIPVVGPALGAGMAAYGLYQGGKQIVNAWEVSENATTDAEAKAAWEAIGSGAGTVALSAAGLKGSVGVLKGQLAGGSTTVQAVKALQNKSASNIAETIVREGIKETAHNVGAVAKTTGAKAKSGWESVKGVIDDVRTNGISSLGTKITNGIAQFADDAGAYIGKKAGQVTDFFKRTFTKDGRAAAKAQASATVKAQIADGTRIEVNSKSHTCTNNSNVKWNSKKGMYELTEGNTVTYYNKKGLIDSKVTTVPNGLGGKTSQVTTVSYKNGQPAGTTVTQDYLDGSVKTTTTNAKGQTSSQTVNKDGVVTHKQLKTGETYDRYVDIDDMGNRTTRHKINANGDIVDGMNKILEYELPGLGEYTNEFLFGVSILDDIE